VSRWSVATAVVKLLFYGCARRETRGKAEIVSSVLPRIDQKTEKKGMTAILRAA